MAKKKKKENIVGEIDINGNITKYDNNTSNLSIKNKKRTNNIVGEVDLDGNITKYDTLGSSTSKKKNQNKSFDFSINDEEDKNLLDRQQQQLLKEREKINKQITNYKREEKNQWWDSKKNPMENAGNVLYKLFVEKQDNKYKNDDAFQNLLDEQKRIKESLEDIAIKKESKNMSDIKKVGYTIQGNLENSAKGITNTVKKVLGQTPSENDIKKTYGERLSEEARKQTDGLAGVGLDILGSTVRMVPQMATGSPTVATAVGFANYGGSAYNEAKRNGATEDQATKYGATVGALETSLEKLLGGFENIYGKSATGKLTNKIMSKVIKNSGVRKTLSGMTGEFTEEYLQEFLEPVIKNAILEEDNGADFWNTMKKDFKAGLKQLSSQLFNKENLYAGTLGAVTSGLYNGLGSISNSINSRNNVLPKYSDTIQTNNNSLNSLTTNNQQIQNNVVNNTLNNNSTSINNQVQTNFQYERSNNAKIDNLRASASKYFDNSTTTKNLINTYEKIIGDKNYNVIFDDSITNDNGNVVNAKINTLNNGEVEIRVNPNSSRAGEFLLMHEVTHAIETDDMKNLVLDYARNHEDFNEALESLKQTYGTNDVSSEVLADISGQLFGNQEFINNLSLEKPNIFKRIYNSIVSLANKVTGNSKEGLFIRDLKNKWETAYRNTTSEQSFNNVNKQNLYSLESLKDGTTFVRTESGLFSKDDGTPMTEREIYKTLIGKKITLNDGTNVEIIDRLPKKNMYNELFKRYPRSKNINDIKKINTTINENMEELLSNSKDINTRPDVNGRHNEQNITGFNTREVTFYDGNQAYNLTLSIAVLQDGKKIAYAKKMLKENNKLLSKIKQEGMSSTSNKGRSSQFPQVGNSISQSKENVKLPTNYSMQQNTNNSQNTDNNSFSLNNAKNWNEYLEENYKSSGTKTYMNRIKGTLPTNKQNSYINSETKNDTQNVKQELPKDPTKASSYENVSNYNDQIKEIRSVISEFASLERNDLISEKTYDSINGQIRKLISKLDSSSVDDFKKIDSLANKVFKNLIDGKSVNSISETIYNTITNKRKAKINEYRKLAESMIGDIANWNDKKLGISYQTETMKRNIFDIIPDKNTAKQVYETYFQPISKNEASAKKMINSYNERIKELNLNNKESVAVQMYGEYKYNPETKLTGLQVDEYIEKNNLDINKIKNSVEVFRNTYDELINKVNDVLIEQGYKPIEYRKGYFPHFIEDKATSIIGKFAEKLGWKINKNQLPTDIAGMTEIFKPGKRWTAFSQQRTGDATDYNALKGFDTYIRGASDLIYHTADIQKLRALENEIRYEYSSDTVKKQIDEVNNDSDLDAMEKQEEINKIFERFNNQMPNFVTEIRRYTDGLANKKSIDDRNIEHKINRTVYSTMTNIQKRVSANMVGLNVSSAFTNFIPITQGYSQISTKSMIIAIKDTIANQVRNDGFDNNSTFLTNRLKNPDNLYKTGLDKFNDKASFLFEGIDSITSNILVRGKYYDNIKNGMSEIDAMKNADEFAKDVMAGRSKGEMPTIYNEKNFFTKLFTSFQLEVKNQYGYMFKDLPKDLKDKGLSTLIGAFFKMFAGAWLYNKFAESLTGRKSAFSPIDIVKETVDTATNKNLSTMEKLGESSKNILEEAPFVGGLLGGGRLPINSAIPDVKTFEYFVNSFSDDKDKKKTAISNLKKELSKPFFYLAMPVGGGQLKKTVEGLSMYSKDKKVKGSYTTSGKLRFPVKEDILSKTRSAIFGQYSSKEAREYFDRGETPLTEKQIEEYKNLKVPITKYWKYREDLRNINQIKADKDKSGKTINGSAKGKKAFEIMNNKLYSNKEKNYLLGKLSDDDTKDNDETIDSLKILKNDKKIYKYYFGLNEKGKENFRTAINDYDFTVEELYDFNKNIDKTTSSNKKSSITNYLVNSNLSDKKVAYLYELKGYMSEDESKSILNSKLPIKSYIDLKQRTSNLTSAVKNGKTVSGSKKKQVLRQVNNTNGLSKEQKLLAIYLLGYSISDGDFRGYTKNSSRKIVYNYVNSLKLSVYDKKQILEKAGYKIYKNGKVGW